MGPEGESIRDEVAEALAALGLYLEPGESPQQPREWHLWPEHLAAFELFLGLQTQWVVGMGGPVGLAYAGVESCLRLYGLKPVDRRQRFAELQHIERGWLAGWHEKHDKKGAT
jgi:hypothetical protein